MARMSFWRMCSIAVAGAVTTLAIGVGADPAAAAIRCEGNYQVQDGNRFATPYCEDLNIVRVASEYGVRVSFDQIRYNPGKVEQVCRVIGDDLRVKDRCKNYMPDSGRDTFQ